MSLNAARSEVALYILCPQFVCSPVTSFFLICQSAWPGSKRSGGTQVDSKPMTYSTAQLLSRGRIAHRTHD